MSFWKSKRCTKLNDKVIQMAHEEAVDWIYKYERKTLAIAKMSYYRSFNFDRDVLGKRRSETDDFVMIGALHEGSDAKRVHCEVRFTDHPSENDFVGDCTLTHIGDEGESHRRPLMVSVSICDADTHWRRASMPARLRHFGGPFLPFPDLYGDRRDPWRSRPIAGSRIRPDCAAPRIYDVAEDHPAECAFRGMEYRWLGTGPFLCLELFGITMPLELTALDAPPMAFGRA